MTIYDIMNLFMDADIQKIIIYDVEYGKDIYEGFYSDIPDDMQDYEVTSIDNLNKTEILTLNVVTE